ncbi:hypothetical protein FCH28_05280 [Streptomyces piniterrae]|uniref:Uncharacterized protein n=1 Tax=Streptomyces piniterrae TaxID=2571125 RepID=A0A4U0NR73_9ACTN|nr:hypothetical protein [Streptomyces piniterrae]TJZ56910.1 hypothetical protein FCH28_05280 [Streptomyces piniterrae]
MRVRIDSGDRDGDVGAGLTAQFAQWLAQDRSVNQYVEIRPVRPEQTDGAMSADLVEWLNLVVSTGFSTAALVYAHRSFRASLPPRLRRAARMVIESDGVRVTVEDGTEDDVARVVAALDGRATGRDPDALHAPERPAGDAAQVGTE